MELETILHVPRDEKPIYHAGLYELLVHTSDYFPSAYRPVSSLPELNVSPSSVPELIRDNGADAMRYIRRIMAELPSPILPPEQHKNFESSSHANLQTNYNLGGMTGDPALNGYALTERHDFSKHDGQVPHLNQDIIGDAVKRLINSGKSKKSEDGFKGLGPSHSINYWEEKK